MEDRYCSRCGGKMQPFMPRKGGFCQMCAQNEERAVNRVAIRITQGAPARNLSSAQALSHHLAGRKPVMMKVAHDSGDGETLFHCPFCGSGQIVARSDGAVDCDFCNTAFTVQVQPQMPAFPQTINGVPIDVPGMPKGGEDADVPPGEAAAAGYPPDAGGSDPADPNATAPTDDQLPADGGSDDAPEDSDDSSPPPFAKNSARLGLVTASGARVDRQAYMQHLALLHTDGYARDAVLVRVRAENGR